MGDKITVNANKKPASSLGRQYISPAERRRCGWLTPQSTSRTRAHKSPTLESLARLREEPSVPSACHAAHDSAQKACNSCLSPKDVIYNVAAGGCRSLQVGVVVLWVHGCVFSYACEAFATLAMCFHFVAFYAVGLGWQVVCAIFSPTTAAGGKSCCILFGCFGSKNTTILKIYSKPNGGKNCWLNKWQVAGREIKWIYRQLFFSQLCISITSYVQTALHKLFK